MNEGNRDTTRELPGATPFEQRVLAEFAALRQEVSAISTKVGALDTRLTTLEEKVDARLRETRPIWEGMRTMLEEINSHMRQLTADMFNTRAHVFELEQRQRPPVA